MFKHYDSFGKLIYGIFNNKIVTCIQINMLIASTCFANIR